MKLAPPSTKFRILPMNREDWRLVGIALLEGRKLHPANKAFGDWCLENGFTLDPAERSNAIWFAEKHDEVVSVLGPSQDGLCNPTGIRKAYRKAKRAAETGAPSVPTFTNDDALYALKLAAVAERGGTMDLPEALAALEDALRQDIASGAQSSLVVPSNAVGVAPVAKPTSESICSLIFLALNDIQNAGGEFDTEKLREKVQVIKPDTLDLLISTLIKVRQQT